MKLCQKCEDAIRQAYDDFLDQTGFMADAIFTAKIVPESECEFPVHKQLNFERSMIPAL